MAFYVPDKTTTKRYEGTGGVAINGLRSRGDNTGPTGGGIADAAQDEPAASAAARGSIVWRQRI